MISKLPTNCVAIAIDFYVMAAKQTRSNLSFIRFHIEKYVYVTTYKKFFIQLWKEVNKFHIGVDNFMQFQNMYLHVRFEHPSIFVSVSKVEVF